ncbi:MULTISPECIES: glutathione S-transferase [Motilimonas]|uniref:Glutathione S-transferase n=1 Tax=Motilimonas cestriensis TaxID=2742685 RepID=A0ABS8W6H8_9GAMM|nr:MULTISPECIES: glutathione S-transferase [Motilimonas]MCE0557979.1 glutathione S-transferase [Motilimonas sp. E26]MCE2593346.1 glutathione S-transferase [Motilimonas cestriensis]MDO6527304.1 glutathione S-transferase [Motilimonas sp. 1_MG-2023]
MTNLILHSHPLSGHSHRVALFLSILKLDYTSVTVDLAKGEQQQPAFLQLNPLGQVPVLQDDNEIIADSNGILVYLARQYDESGQWMPQQPIEQGRVQGFLSLAAGQLANGPGALRRHKLLGVAIDIDAAMATSEQLLAYLEQHLSGRDWLVGKTPTIADLAIYTYTKLAPQGGINLAPFQSINLWLARVEALDGFIAPTEIK